MTDADNWDDWEGRTVIGSDGQRVGRISQVFLDHETGTPTWGSVHTGLVGAGHAFVPLQRGRWRGDAFEAPYPAQLCKRAPHFTEDQELTHADQRRLFEHYGMDGGAPSGGPRVEDELRAQPGPEAEDQPHTMTRSEERAGVARVRSPGETVRLRKTIITEPVSRTVTVRREELRIEREPVNATAASGGRHQLGEEVHELILMHEEPVLEKTVVPVERVRLTKRVTEAQREAQGELGNEQIEVERTPER